VGGASTSHPALDLDRSIRPGLDILANEIVIALKKRSRFARNDSVYAPGLVRGNPLVSLLEHVLARTEQVHAELGRYTYASQDAFTEVAGVDPVIQRRPPSNPIEHVRSRTGERVLERYLAWVRGACREGSEPDTFGETVTADVNALLAILERVNLGKYVAESKLERDQQAFRDTGGDREAILGLIVRTDREVEVLELARRLAAHYELEAQHAVSVFKWMIELTKDVEVQYIRRRLDLPG
jgi:chorismate mutase